MNWHYVMWFFVGASLAGPAYHLGYGHALAWAERLYSGKDVTRG